MGRHHANGYVTYPVVAYDTGTRRVITYKSQVLRKNKLAPVARCAMGALVAFGIALALFGVTVPPDLATPAPALVATVAAAPPVTLEAPVAPMVEPPVLTAAVPTVVAPRKRGECR